MNKRMLAFIIIIMFSVIIVAWAFFPLIGPLMIPGRGPDQIIEWIHKRNPVVLEDPTPMFKGNWVMSYHTWAMAEWKKRCIASAVIWGVIAIAFVWWVKKKGREKLGADPVSKMS